MFCGRWSMVSLLKKPASEFHLATLRKNPKGSRVMWHHCVVRCDRCSIRRSTRLGLDGAKAMNTIARIASVLILGSGALLAGCATQEELAVVRATAVGADQKADVAIQRADQAGQKADMAGQRADQATQIAQAAHSQAEQAQATANAANATAQNAKGVADTVQSALNAHTVASLQVRRLARGERG